jgi:phosphatidylglycerol:prolipoprotein diacylglycerol transferase
MNFGRFGIYIGPVTISYFGLILVAAMAAGGYLSYREAARRGERADYVLDVMTWALIGAVIVARLFYILNPPPSAAILHDTRWYLTHPFDLQAGPLAVWSGGLSVAGALVGGLLGAVICLYRRRVDLWRWADILAPGILLGLAMAGWANIVNEQLYGPPTMLPWGMRITRLVPPYTTPEYADARYHPTSAYLALWALAGFGVLLWLRHKIAKRLQTGDLFLLAMLLYLPGMFLADFLRVDVPKAVFGLTGVQILAILGLVWTLYYGYRRLRAGGQARSLSAAEPAMPPDESHEGPTP